MASAASYPGPTLSDSAFGNLIDLARLQTSWWAHAEVCDVCHTINLGSAHLCKCCAHKLPAFYASEALECEVESAPPRPFLWATAIASLAGQFAARCHEAHRSFATHLASPVDALE